MQLQQPDVDN